MESYCTPLSQYWRAKSSRFSALSWQWEPVLQIFGFCWHLCLDIETALWRRQQKSRRFKCQWFSRIRKWNYSLHHIASHRITSHHINRPYWAAILGHTTYSILQPCSPWFHRRHGRSCCSPTSAGMQQKAQHNQHMHQNHQNHQNILSIHVSRSLYMCVVFRIFKASEYVWFPIN